MPARPERSSQSSARLRRSSAPSLLHAQRERDILGAPRGTGTAPGSARPSACRAGRPARRACSCRRCGCRRRSARPARRSCRKVVDLPQPDGPMMRDELAGGDIEVDAADRVMVRRSACRALSSATKGAAIGSPAFGGSCGARRATPMKRWASRTSVTLITSTTVPMALIFGFTWPCSRLRMRTGSVSCTPPTNQAIMNSSNDTAAERKNDAISDGVQNGSTTRSSAADGDAPRFHAAGSRSRLELAEPQPDQRHRERRGDRHMADDDRLEPAEQADARQEGEHRHAEDRHRHGRRDRDQQREGRACRGSGSGSRHRRRRSRARWTAAAVPSADEHAVDEGVDDHLVGQDRLVPFQAEAAPRDGGEAVGVEREHDDHQHRHRDEHEQRREEQVLHRTRQPRDARAAKRLRSCAPASKRRADASRRPAAVTTISTASIATPITEARGHCEPDLTVSTIRMDSVGGLLPVMNSGLT